MIIDTFIRCVYIILAVNLNSILRVKKNIHTLGKLCGVYFFYFNPEGNAILKSCPNLPSGDVRFGRIKLFPALEGITYV